MGYLDVKALVVSREKMDMDGFAFCARKSNYRNYDTETAITNVISKMQGTDYGVCILYEQPGDQPNLVRVIDRIRNNVKAKRVPVVVVTNLHATETDMDSYYEAGAQLVIPKMGDSQLKMLLSVVASFSEFVARFPEKMQFRNYVSSR